MPEGLTMPGVMLDPLPKRPVGEGDHAEDGILTRGLHCLRQIRCPLLVEPTRSGRVATDSGGMKEPSLTVCPDRIAKVVEQDICVMHARVERDRARQLLMSPRGDQQVVAAADGRLHDELQLAD